MRGGSGGGRECVWGGGGEGARKKVRGGGEMEGQGGGRGTLKRKREEEYVGSVMVEQIVDKMEIFCTAGGD